MKIHKVSPKTYLAPVLINGVLSLEPLYRFVKTHGGEKDKLALKGSTTLGREFGERRFEITKELEPFSGLYWWYYYIKGGKNYEWESIYVGETMDLKERINKELDAERWCFWRIQYTKTQLRQIGNEILNQDYSMEPALDKRRASHIAWVYFPSASKNTLVGYQNHLIEMLKPRNAIQALPEPQYQLEAEKIRREFIRLVTLPQNVNTRFPITLCPDPEDL
jgi:hypothetical protein